MTFIGIILIYGNGILNSIFIFLDARYYWDTKCYNSMLKAPAASKKFIEMEIVGRSTAEKQQLANPIRRPSLATHENKGNELRSILAEDNNSEIIDKLEFIVAHENQGTFVSNNSIFKKNYKRVCEIILEESRNKVEF